MSEDYKYTVQYLIEKGADVKMKDNSGVSVTMVYKLVVLIGVCVTASFPATIILCIHDQLLLMLCLRGCLIYIHHQIV